MLDIAFIREHPELVREGARKKGLDCNLDALLECDERRRRAQVEVDELRRVRNRKNDEIPRLAGPDKQAVIAEMKRLSAELKEKEAALAGVLGEFNALMLRVPNPPAPEVPVGRDESENVVVRTWGEPPRFDFSPKDHVELGEILDIIDIPRGVRLAGSRNYLLKNEAVLLELGVLRMALDLMIERGFTPMIVPHLVKEEAMVGTGYFPLGVEQAYAVEKDGLYLIGTSEVSVTSYHMGEILEEKDLPLHYCGYSVCFRREAGTYGKDTRGLYRIHQFQKVEQVSLCRADPEESAREHALLLSNAEEMLQRLRLPYRVVDVCTGDLGQGQVRKNDLEAWMPSRGGYGETHSCSTFHDFQARRLGIRYRDGEGKLRFCHTLNNTVIASPRILIPILENYQNADGSVTVPEALRPYVGGLERIAPRRS